VLAFSLSLFLLSLWNANRRLHGEDRRLQRRAASGLRLAIVIGSQYRHFRLLLPV
jgi:hypothetical protein